MSKMKQNWWRGDWCLNSTYPQVGDVMCPKVDLMSQQFMFLPKIMTLGYAAYVLIQTLRDVVGNVIYFHDRNLFQFFFFNW